MRTFLIDPDISKSNTLPGWFYRDEQFYNQVKEKIFARNWTYLLDTAPLAQPGMAYPVTLLEGVLNEPLVFTSDKQSRIHCLSNVCTHRGKIVVENPGPLSRIRCGYHGRCFDLDGAFRSMPEFEQTTNFPSEADHLPKVPFFEWMGMLFVSLQPAVPFKEIIQPISDRIGWMPLNNMRYDETTSKDYTVKANWALYCDNYLEGFHIPFVHPGLNQAIEFGKYEYELYPYCSLQLGIAKDDEPYFSPPAGSIDHGLKVYAYYYWVFPNLMFNFYPWGLSLNVVEPINHHTTRIRFRTYYFADNTHERKLNQIDLTEMEDEAVVESVQLGIQSRLYKAGRYSASQEKGVHHFHRLLSHFLNL